MIINSMLGLGDNIYQRAFIKHIKQDVWLTTPWPEIYQDMPHVHFMPSGTKLRTQAKNELTQDKSIYSAPKNAKNIGRVSYGERGIFAGMRAFFRVNPAQMDLPDYGKPVVDGKYIVVRTVTVRAEWVAATRNPLPEYVSKAVDAARQKGYKIVSVADLEDGKEWAVGELPYADIRYHNGELTVTQLLALIQHASGVIGGIGWILPACIAYQTRLLCICGGQGGYNHPDKITDKSQNLKRVTFAVPDNFCMCKQKEHNCDKSISKIDQLISKWASDLE